MPRVSFQPAEKIRSFKEANHIEDEHSRIQFDVSAEYIPFDKIEIHAKIIEKVLPMTVSPSLNYEIAVTLVGRRLFSFANIVKQYG